MSTGAKSTRTASHRILRPRLLLSAALAALLVAAPTGEQTSALAMNLGSGFAAARFNGGPHVFVPRGPIGGTAIRNGGEVGPVGRGDPGRSVSSNPCRSGRYNADRCGKVVVNNGGDQPAGDHPGGGDGRGGDGRGGDGNPRHPPRGPIWRHPPHWTAPPEPIVTVNPPIVVTQPTAIGNSSPQGLGPQTVRRGGTGVPPTSERRYRPDEVVVELATSAPALQIDALLRRFRLARLQSVDFPLGGTTLMRWRITDRRSVPVVVRALETDATVLSAQPNYLFALQDETATRAAPGAPAPGAAAPSEGDPGQYILGKMHLPQAHELVKGDKVLVAVIDSGIDVAHPDLAGDIAGSFDAIGTGLQTHPHGTAIAGAIAAHGRLMGAAPAAQILAVRAFGGIGDTQEGTTFAIMSGLGWAVSHGARVINMSFAGPQDPGITRSLAAAHDKGVVLIAAAGNKGAKSPPLYPAADPNVIAVTATDANDQLPAFANRGRYVAVAAPGVDLMLLAPNGTLQLSSGTSFSAAYVTGTAALMLERKRDLGPDTLRQALTETAHRLTGNEKGPDDQSGAGLVDAYQAVLSLAPTPAMGAANSVPAAARR